VSAYGSRRASPWVAVMLAMPRSRALAHRVVEHLLLEVEDVEPSFGSEPFGHGDDWRLTATAEHVKRLRDRRAPLRDTRLNPAASHSAGTGEKRLAGTPDSCTRDRSRPISAREANSRAFFENRCHAGSADENRAASHLRDLHSRATQTTRRPIWAGIGPKKCGFGPISRLADPRLRRSSAVSTIVRDEGPGRVRAHTCCSTNSIAPPAPPCASLRSCPRVALLPVVRSGIATTHAA
jgi:hypothetical protein